MATEPQVSDLSGDLTEPPIPIYLTVKMAAHYYPALDERYIRRLVDKRRIPFHKPDGKIFIKRDDLEAYLEGGLIEPTDHRYGRSQ